MAYDPVDGYTPVDVMALADRRKARKVRRYGMRHKETGLWLHKEQIAYAARFFVSPEPFPRPMSACKIWLKDMLQPEEWEIIELEMRPA